MSMQSDLASLISEEKSPSTKTSKKQASKPNPKDSLLHERAHLSNPKISLSPSALTSNQTQLDQSPLSFILQNANVSPTLHQPTMLPPLPILNYPEPPSIIPPLAENYDAIISSDGDSSAANTSSAPSSKDSLNRFVVPIAKSKLKLMEKMTSA